MLVFTNQPERCVVRKNPILFITLSILFSSLFLNSASADIEWGGVYRFEGNFFKNSELDRDRELSYGLHHLALRPKIVAGDGLKIFGQFDIFNNASYPNSQLGQIWGSGVRTGNQQSGTSISNSNSISQNQKAETIEVSQLYLTLAQEYG